VSRRKVLVPAFTRAIKDSFVHARVAGLMAFMACGELFELEEVAKGVLPIVSSTLIDGQKYFVFLSSCVLMKLKLYI
jgi:SCY1-like protein 1